MRKLLITVLAISSMFVMASCKSNEVRKAEKLISEIGKVDVDSWDEIEAAEEALDDLSKNDYAKVDNIRVFEKAKDKYDEIIEDYNERISNALDKYNNVNENIFTMRNTFEALDELQEIRDELPDVVYENYIVFEEDDEMEEWIETKREAAEALCYPETHVLKFEFWYATLSSNVTATVYRENGNEITYDLGLDVFSTPGSVVDSIENSYNSYLREEGAMTTCHYAGAGGEGNQRNYLLKVTIRD